MHSPRASPHESTSPNLSLPALRPPRAEPHSPQVTGAAHGSQGRAVPGSPDLTEAAIASPTLSLPSPVHIMSASVNDGEHAAAGFSNPEATQQDPQEDAEVYVLSEIWKVFEQVIKQVNR